MRKLRSHVVGVVVGAVFALFSTGAGIAHAQKAKAAGDGYVQVIKDALIEFDAGNYGEARVLFEQAHSLRPSARTLRGMGMASFELKEYVRSEKELNASLVDLRSPLAEAQRHEVLALLLRLERYIGKLIVHTSPENATVTLDGSTVERETKVDLGRHELSVQAPGYRPLNRELSIEGGKTQNLELALTPVDLDPKSVQPVAAAPAETAPTPAESGGDALLPPMAAAIDPRDRDSGGIFEQWWFWTIVGAVAVGGAVAAVALTAKSKTEPPLRGTTGRTIQVLSWSR